MTWYIPSFDVITTLLFLLQVLIDGHSRQCPSWPENLVAQLLPFTGNDKWAKWHSCAWEKRSSGVSRIDPRLSYGCSEISGVSTSGAFSHFLHLQNHHVFLAYWLQMLEWLEDLKLYQWHDQVAFDILYVDVCIARLFSILVQHRLQIFNLSFHFFFSPVPLDLLFSTSCSVQPRCCICVLKSLKKFDIGIRYNLMHFTSV